MPDKVRTKRDATDRVVTDEVVTVGATTVGPSTVDKRIHNLNIKITCEETQKGSYGTFL